MQYRDNASPAASPRSPRPTASDNPPAAFAPGIGLADAVCDIVSSGSTLLTNGLHEVETILKSQAVIVGNKNLDTEKQAILEKLLFRIRSVKSANENKYILLNAPVSAIDDICKILPGMKSPTIVPPG